MPSTLKYAALAACLLTLTGGAAAVPDEGALASARRLRLGGEPGQAAETLRAVPTHEASVELQHELVLALLASGQADDALAVAEKAAATAPDEPLAVRARALALSARYEGGRALEAIEPALTKHPGNGPLLAAKGRALWELRRAKSAVEALQAAAGHAPSAAEANYYLGRIFHFKGWRAEGAFPGWHDEPEYRAKAEAAFRAAAAASPEWYAPYLGLGDTLLAADRPTEALAAFDRALERGPNVTAALAGRWSALEALNRVDEVKAEVARATESSDARQVDAARRGFELVGLASEAEAAAQKLLSRFPASAGAAAVTAARVGNARRAKQYSSVVDLAASFPGRFPSSPDRLAVQDALIEAYMASPDTPPATLLQAIDARIDARPDPAVFVAGSAALANRRVLLDDAIRLGDASVAAASTFINENLGSYKMEGKIQNALGRSRATGLDLAGWAHFLENDLPSATTKLEEAERLSRGNDMANQYHLGELARSKGELDAARERYLTALSLQGSPALKDAGTKALADVYAKLGNDPAGFEAYLKAELDRRTEDRRERLVQSMLDQKVPAIVVDDLAGGTINLGSLRGKVVLLNFFSSWCGACRGELPHVKTAYEAYRNDPDVAFLLVSLDDDPRRLARYLGEMKFPFPVAHTTQKAAEEAFRVFDVPATFYVDRSGVVRYEARGGEIHGQAADRVQWFIDELKRQ